MTRSVGINILALNILLLLSLLMQGGCGSSDSGSSGETPTTAQIIIISAADELTEEQSGGIPIEIALDQEVSGTALVQTEGDLRVSLTDNSASALTEVSIDLDGTNASTVYLFAVHDADHSDDLNQALIVISAQAVNSPETSAQFDIIDNDFDISLISSSVSVGEAAALGIEVYVSSDNAAISDECTLTAGGDLRISLTNNSAAASASLDVNLNGTAAVTVYAFGIADADTVDDLDQPLTLTCVSADNSPVTLELDIIESQVQLSINQPEDQIEENNTDGIAFTVALDSSSHSAAADVAASGNLRISLSDVPETAVLSDTISLNGANPITVYVFALADADYGDEADQAITITWAGAVNSPATVLFDIRDTSPWVVTGPGAGGGLFAPASSPHNPDLMFVSCDMGGFYRSLDAGLTWTMYPWTVLKRSNYCRAAFHPADPAKIYYQGYKSEDGGDTWSPISASQPFGETDIRDLCIGPAGRIILARSSGTTYISRNGGNTWSTVSGGGGGTTGMHIDAASPESNRTIYLATGSAIRKSVDDGYTWSTITNGLPWTDIQSFAGASDSGLTRTSLYCVLEGRDVSGAFGGGVYISTDRGISWSSAMGSGINTTLGLQDAYGAGSIPQYSIVKCAEGYPDSPAVACPGSTGYYPPFHRTVYTTDNGGSSWQAVYFYDFRYDDFNVDVGWLPRATNYGWGGFATDDGFSMNPGNPDVMMLASGGELHVTLNRGQDWRQAYSELATGQPAPSLDYNENHPGAWSSVGLETTTCWRYVIDPFDYNRHIICYTDIGMQVSDDAGQSWTHGMDGSPWGNTTYDLVFDPDIEGLCWAAMSNVHDIPNWGYTDASVSGSGGVCVSTDSGKNWLNITNGLPNDPVTCIELDPSSASGNRTLYCAVYTRGFYKSTDNGINWSAINTGIDLSNDHAYLIRRHPDGTLFALISGYRNGTTFSPVGALYRSTNAGANWTDITASNPIKWPIGFTADPTNSNIVYLATAATPGGTGDGGVFRTENGGTGWEHVLDNADVASVLGGTYTHSYFLTISPYDSDHVFLGGSHGIWDSKDGGDTWRAYGSDDIRFNTCLRITFDPLYPRLIYVTTFGGGVWKGLMKD